MGLLPGSTVSLEWTNGVLRRWLKAGFHLRIDGTYVYLCYGHEDIIAKRTAGANFRREGIGSC